ncbi:MAG: sporulation transcriptional regulator SpoIIID [Candidatus Merdivicinus sp.]|jgi:hypothetical protein
MKGDGYKRGKICIPISKIKQGARLMIDCMEERCVQFAQYIIDTHATVRATAKKFDYSKSTVHKDDGVIIGKK